MFCSGTSGVASKAVVGSSGEMSDDGVSAFVYVQFKTPR